MGWRLVLSKKKTLMPTDAALDAVAADARCSAAFVRNDADFAETLVAAFFVLRDLIATLTSCYLIANPIELRLRGRTTHFVGMAPGKNLLPQVLSANGNRGSTAAFH